MTEPEVDIPIIPLAMAATQHGGYLLTGLHGMIFFLISRRILPIACGSEIEGPGCSEGFFDIIGPALHNKLVLPPFSYTLSPFLQGRI